MRFLFFILLIILPSHSELLEGADPQLIFQEKRGWVQFEVNTDKLPDLIKHLEYNSTTDLTFSLVDQTGKIFKGIIQSIDPIGKTGETITLTGVLNPLPQPLIQHLVLNQEKRVQVNIP